MASLDDTVVLVTCVAAKTAKAGQDFFPLTVDYQEKTYAAGKIPGGFFKREGRPSEKEILTSRLIDRPIRPLFPDGFYNEVQIVATVMSVDPEIDPDIPAMIGASAALALVRHPVRGPDRRGARRLRRRPVRAQSDEDRARDVAAQPRRRRHRSRRADGGIGSAGAARGSDARRRRVRTRAAAGRRSNVIHALVEEARQAAVGLAAARQGRGADRQGRPRRPRRDAARRLPAAPEAGSASRR